MVPLEDCKKNLEKEISILKKTGAKLIWCSPTHVPNRNKWAYVRRKGAEREFNEAAMEVMGRHPEILVNDLCKLIDSSPVFGNWRNVKRCALLQARGAEAARRGGRLSGPQGARQRRGGRRALSCGHHASLMTTVFPKHAQETSLIDEAAIIPKAGPLVPISISNSIMSTTPLHRPAPPEATSSSGALGPEFLAGWRGGYVMSAGDRACHNAVTNNAINSPASNRDVLRGNDGHFSQAV